MRQEAAQRKPGRTGIRILWQCFLHLLLYIFPSLLHQFVVLALHTFQLTPAFFHDPDALHNPWSAAWVCFRCGVWDVASRGMPANAEVLELAADQLTADEWAAASRTAWKATVSLLIHGATWAPPPTRWMYTGAL